MKTHFSKLVALALFAAALTGVALAQNDIPLGRASIPFDFYAGSKLLHAGEYTISANLNDRVVILQEKASGRTCFLTGVADESSRDDRTVLTFKLVGGEVYALRELQGADLGVSFSAKGPQSTVRAQNQKSQSVEVIAEAR